MIDLYQEIMGKANEVIGVYIDKDKAESFRANEIYKESCKYLKNFMEWLEERFQQEDAKALTINDIKQEPEARKHIKCVLDKEVATIAQYRPDIVESWKYYQEFERMCKELD